MKKIIILCLICFFTSSCLTRTWFKPADFTYQYNQKYTGLDMLINTNDCFVINNFAENHPRYIIFFNDGLTCLSYVLPEKDEFSKTYPKEMTDKHIWGRYIAEDKLIKIQQILDTGADGGVIVNQYIFIIESPVKLVLTAWGNKGMTIPVKDISYSFHPLKNRIDSSSCWLLNKKWFWDKEVWKKRNK